MAYGEALLDANVLLRFLTDQPRELADRAASILHAADARRMRLLVAPLTLAEIVFVLESSYKWSRHDIADRLRSLIDSDVLEFLEKDAVMNALAWYHDITAVHFADAYLAAVAAERQSPLISFDRGLERIPGLEVIATPDALRR